MKTRESGFESSTGYPALCRCCAKQFGVFHSAGHPDDGMKYACGSMVEYMEAGLCMWSCNRFAQKQMAQIIDADVVQQKAQEPRKTNVRPVIIA